MRDSLQRANEYLYKNSGETDKAFRPRYHLSPPVGWMNDPNGVCFYRGQLHVFYQFYPYGECCGGVMHWGHAATSDNCVFRHYPVALAPDKEDESSCFSGGAVVCGEGENQRLPILYTKHFQEGDKRREVQGLAESADGVHFEKRQSPAIGAEDLPDFAAKEDFRDPNPVALGGGKYAVFIGSRTEDKRCMYLVYLTENFKSFRFLNAIRYPIFGEMGECPDFFRLDGKDVLLFSAIDVREEGNRFRNFCSSLYFIGKFDEETGAFEAESGDEIDGGHHFYAPQTCENDCGERLMIAWMECWGNRFYQQEYKHGYCGGMTYPRVLTIKEGRLCQAPACGIEKYRVPLDKEANAVGKCFDMTLTLSEGGFISFENVSDEGDRLMLMLKDGRFVADMSGRKYDPQSARLSKFVYGKQVSLRLLSDVSSLEIFLDDGRETFTERYYIDGETLGIKKKGIRICQFYALCLPEENFEIVR